MPQASTRRAARPRGGRHPLWHAASRRSDPGPACTGWFPRDQSDSIVSACDCGMLEVPRPWEPESKAPHRESRRCTRTDDARAAYRRDRGGSAARSLRGCEAPHRGVWPQAPVRRMVRRMPRLQVYLPDELYRAVKERRLPASELLQGAVRAELRRRAILEETDRYLSELVDEVGEPSPAAVARAERLAQRVRGGKAGSSKAS